MTPATDGETALNAGLSVVNALPRNAGPWVYRSAAMACRSPMLFGRFTRRPLESRAAFRHHVWFAWENQLRPWTTAYLAAG